MGGTNGGTRIGLAACVAAVGLIALANPVNADPIALATGGSGAHSIEDSLCAMGERWGVDRLDLSRALIRGGDESDTLKSLSYTMNTVRDLVLAQLDKTRGDRDDAEVRGLALGHRKDKHKKNKDETAGADTTKHIKSASGAERETHVPQITRLDAADPSPTPEPASLVLLGTGLIAAAWRRRTS